MKRYDSMKVGIKVLTTAICIVFTILSAPGCNERHAEGDVCHDKQEVLLSLYGMSEGGFSFSTDHTYIGSNQDTEPAAITLDYSYLTYSFDVSSYQRVMFHTPPSAQAVLIDAIALDGTWMQIPDNEENSQVYQNFIPSNPNCRWDETGITGCPPRGVEFVQGVPDGVTIENNTSSGVCEAFYGISTQGASSMTVFVKI